MSEAEQSFAQRKAAQLSQERVERGESTPIAPADPEPGTPEATMESAEVEQDGQELYPDDNAELGELEDSPEALDSETPSDEDQDDPDGQNVDWQKRYTDLQSETQAIRESRGEMEQEQAAAMSQHLELRFQMEDANTEALQRAELTRNVMSGNAQQFKNINWAAVPPEQLPQVQAQAQQALQMEQQAEQAYAQFKSQVDEQREVMKQREAAVAKTRLKRSIPDWGNDTYGAIRDFATSQGLPEREFNDITNPVIIEALYTASQVKNSGSSVRKSTTRKAATPRGKAARRQPRDSRGKFESKRVEPNQRGSFADKHRHRLAQERSGR